MIRDSIVSDQGSTVCDQGQHCLWSKSALFVIRVSTVYDQSTLFMFGSALLVIRAALSDVRATLFVISISTVCDQGQHCLWLGSTVWHQSQDCLGSGSAMFVIRVSTVCDQGSNVYEAQHCWSGSAPRPGQHCFRNWLCWGLTTRQPLRVILCRLPEKGRKEIEERVEEMKERDREERGTGMKVKKQKK